MDTKMKGWQNKTFTKRRVCKKEDRNLKKKRRSYDSLLLSKLLYKHVGVIHQLNGHWSYGTTCKLFSLFQRQRSVGYVNCGPPCLLNMTSLKTWEWAREARRKDTCQTNISTSYPLGATLEKNHQHQSLTASPNIYTLNSQHRTNSGQTERTRRNNLFLFFHLFNNWQILVFSWTVNWPFSMSLNASRELIVWKKKFLIFKCDTGVDVLSI